MTRGRAAELTLDFLGGILGGLAVAYLVMLRPPRIP